MLLQLDLRGPMSNQIRVVVPDMHFIQVTILLRNKANQLVGPNGPIVQPGLLTWLTLMVHNFVDIGQILTQPVPIDSPDQDLSIGTRLVKI